MAQLRALRQDLVLIPMRGNVDTRLSKLETEGLDGIVLAAAGLSRLGLLHRATHFFSPDEMLPSVGQGALALETRAGDESTYQLIQSLDHLTTHTAVVAEREFLSIVGGGCSVPVAAYAEVDAHRIELTGFIGSREGQFVRDSLSGAPADAPLLARTLAWLLLDAGGRVLLERARVADDA
jgi:hydroxymethylbilane synthase